MPLAMSGVDVLTSETGSCRFCVFALVSWPPAAAAWNECAEVSGGDGWGRGGGA